MKHIKDLSRKGDFGEYYAVTWLWDQGYEVFQNSGCSGPVDMIAIDKKGDTIFIDVKTATTTSQNSNNLCNTQVRTKKQIKLNVQILSFNPATRELKFINHGAIGRPKK